VRGVPSDRYPYRDSHSFDAPFSDFSYLLNGSACRVSRLGGSRSVFFLHILGDFGAHNGSMDVKAEQKHRATPFRCSAPHINAECPALSAPEFQKEQVRLLNPQNVRSHAAILVPEGKASNQRETERCLNKLQ
jgi:hypothetical protein